ncbi:MAG TPA: amino acid adenylation domain-containing protein, partial [Thermomicrobiales bacterium]
MQAQIESVERQTRLSEARRALIEQRLLHALAAKSDGGYVGIPRRSEDSPTPLSFAQERLWFLEQWQAGAAYNIPAPLRLIGALQAEALERTVNDVVARHEALRTTFVMADGQLTQVIAPALAVPLPVTDLRDLPVADREAAAQRLMADEARHPFDLARGPLLRAILLRLTETEHLLLLTMHHIIADGWSLGVLLRELAAHYEAECAGLRVARPALPIQYADYAIWQRKWLRGDVLEKQLAYWERQLAGAPAVLEFPTDRPHPPVATNRGAIAPIVLSRAQTTALKELSQREGATLFMTLLAAFQVLLGRYSGQEDIIVGAPIAGRTRPELEEMIGVFVNSLVLRTDLTGDPGFRTLLGRVREMTLEAYAHQDLPFEQLVTSLHTARDPSRNPLFQVMFSMQSAPLPSSFGALSVERLSVHTGTSQLDLALSLEETDAGLVGTIEYNTDLFEEGTIARMVGHFRTLLAGVVADPSCPISQLPLLTDAECHEIVVDWNATAADYPRERCFHDLFTAQAAKTPEAVAAVFENEQITYRALDQRANQLAHHLRVHSIGPDAFVGVCVERSLEMLVAVLAVMKAGGAYLPLDPAYPRDRLAFMLADAQVRVLLTEQRLLAELPAGEAEVICVDRDRDAIARHPTDPPAPAATPESLAYVIYTSGSTGKPKGAMIPHRALVNLLCSMRDKLGVTASDVVMAATSLSFDIAALELYLPLLVGARVVIAPHDTAKHGRRLGALVKSSGATVMQATPAMWRVLFESGWHGDPRLHILCGGEALSQSLARQLLRAGKRLTNLYGPTETTIWSTLHEVEHAEGPIPLGRPIANTQIYILDRHRHPVPVGVPGELYIGGDGVTHGYLNRPDLTAQRFTPSPFAAESANCLYATGDLARYLPDGTLEFLGRIDNQVKMRGYRIELGEIETLLERQEGVRHAVVMAREDMPGSESLAAYIVPSRQPAPTASALRHALVAQIPDYMVPSAFVLLDAMPMTPNGKVDRRALPAPSAPAGVRDVPFVAPEGILQLQLARIWEEILDVRPVGITDDFFDLGGTSLLAARLVDRIADVCGQEIPLTGFFSGATIEQMETMLLERKDQAATSPVVRIQEGKGKRPFFFLHGDLRDGGIYCVKLARAFDPDRPFYGIHPNGTDGTTVPRTLEAMATDRLAVLRAV